MHPNTVSSQVSEGIADRLDSREGNALARQSHGADWTNGNGSPPSDCYDEVDCVKRDGAGEKESCRVEGKCARGRWNSNELSESENCEGSQLMSTLEEGRKEWRRMEEKPAGFSEFRMGNDFVISAYIAKLRKMTRMH